MAIRRKGRRPRKKLAGVEVIFFDVGGTLVYSNLGHLDLLHEALVVIGYPVTREEVLSANDKARRAVARRRRGLPARLAAAEASRMWLDHLAEELALDLRGEDLEQELAFAMQQIETHQQVVVDDDAVWLLGQLKRRGFRLGVISNWSADLKDYLAERNLACFFEAVIASEAVGSQKPHREIFLKALRAMNCQPSRAIHVGDDYWADVKGARNIGIRAVLVDRDREAIHSDCVTIHALRELNDLL